MQTLQKRIKALDSNENELYKLLEYEQVERIDVKRVVE